MSSRITTVFLIIAVLFSFLVIISKLALFRLPGDNRGYEPEQPIAFSHRLHAGELEMSCQYCHSEATSSRHAGIPAASTCMNCHSVITASLGAVRAEEEAAAKEKRAVRPVVSQELSKLYQALGLDEQMKRAGTPRTVNWIKIHDVPDFVYFDHRAHVNAEVKCQSCHGPVETMERVRQIENLSMGWCINCHRDPQAQGIKGRNPSLDCATCHY
ncbi:MAG: cytochrome c3 family protein [Acidobacteria bacterium]|nr:cytochrome c3 family protein [Acidobacteriota bacterium]